MGDLAEDTSVTQPSEHRWGARLSDEWDIWGPNGGYVASVCLRAAGAAVGLARPVTVACHYLSVGRFDHVDLDVTVLRSTRRTAAVRVHMSQDAVPIADATVWAVASGLEGYEWDESSAPDVASPAEVPSVEERLAHEPEAPRSPFAFARNLQQKPLEWRSQEELAAFPGGAHKPRAWMGFVPPAAVADAWVAQLFCRPGPAHPQDNRWGGEQATSPGAGVRRHRSPARAPASLRRSAGTGCS